MFTVGWLAIAGIPPLSGFWSKGDVLENVYAHYKVLWALGLLTAVLTAYYMTRLQTLAFGGEPRWDKIGPHGEPALHTPHEPTWLMRLPLAVLAFFSIFAGILDLPVGPPLHVRQLVGAGVRGHLYNDHLHSTAVWVLSLTDVAAALIGIIIAYGLWRGANVDKPGPRAGVPPTGLVLGRLLRRRHRPAQPEAGRLLGLGGRRPDHRRCRQRGGATW